MKSLGIKLALQISVTLIVVMVIFATYNAYQQREENTLAFQKKEERITQQLSLILGTPLYHIDYEQIESILRSYLSDQDILAIKVIENQNTAVFLGKLPNTQEVIDLREKSPNFINIERKHGDIYYSDALLGSVEIIFSRQVIQTQMRETLVSLIGSLTLIILVCSLMIALLMKRNVTRPLLRLVQTAKQIAEGNINIQIQERTSRNEIGQLQTAMKGMIHYIQDVGSVAERISNHDLQVKVMPKSDRDVLNHSLTRMINNLQQMIEENKKSLAAIEEQNQLMKQQNWMKDGISQLNSQLSGDLSLMEMCNKATSFVAHYINAGRGVLYTYEPEEQRLRLRGTFAFTEREHLSNTYGVGEGVIGQVALERIPILLRRHLDNTGTITTGTFSGAPLNTYTFPLLYNEELYGVFELASFEAFDEAAQNFLAEATQVIATTLFSAFQRERVQALLGHTKQVSETPPEDEQP